MPKKLTRDEKIDRLIKEFEKMSDSILDDFVKRGNKIGRLAVWKWYRSYSPKYYERKKTLYYGFKIEREGYKMRLHFGPEEMYHVHFVDKIDPTYIYENSFIGGYHGGAIDGENHPNPGIPYWRTPPPNYPYWSFPAKHDESPYKRINAAIDDYAAKVKIRFINKFKKQIYYKLKLLQSKENK